jgi:hypothetical protein
VTGPTAQRRQPRRRRITPNTNTSTTTMISTHNHVDTAASLVGPGAVQADATAAHPSKQLGHGQATSRARIDGRAARGLAGTSAPRDLPADLGWPGGCQPDPVPVKPPLRAHECSLAPSAPGLTAPGPARQLTTRRPRWGRALRATPRQPSPTTATRTTRKEGPAGVNRPNATWEGHPRPLPPSIHHEPQGGPTSWPTPTSPSPAT